MLFSSPIETPQTRSFFLGKNVFLVPLDTTMDQDVKETGRIFEQSVGYPLPIPHGSVIVENRGNIQRILVFSRNDREIQETVQSARLLFDALNQESQKRVLRFLLGFCRTAFKLSKDTTFIEECLHLARQSLREENVRPAAVISPEWIVIEGTKIEQGTQLYLFSKNQIRQSRGQAYNTSGMQLIEPLQPGDHVLALGNTEILWTVSQPAKPLIHVMQSKSIPPLIQKAYHGKTFSQELQARRPMAVMRYENPIHPINAVLETSLSDGAGGLFLQGWIRDPLHLVTGAEIQTPEGSVGIDATMMHRIKRPDILQKFKGSNFQDQETRPGFIAHIPDPSNGRCLQPILRLKTISGNTLEINAPPITLPPAMARDAVLAIVPPHEVTPVMLDTCLAPVAQRLHHRALAQKGIPEVIKFGQGINNPKVSIIIPLYKNLDFLRFQMNAFAVYPEKNTEIIYVLDSPEQHHEVEHHLRGLFLLYKIPITLIVLSKNLGYAAASNIGANHAKAPVLLLLNSDVVPFQRGWISNMEAAFRESRIGIVGPKLLFEDQSIQHAGLYFEQDLDGIWYNHHYYKGMPRDWPGAKRRRIVPGVTGAALMIKRFLFEKVGGISEDYIIGDYEDSDLCLKVEQEGASALYIPKAELYHFERRSIQMHVGYTRTLASMYNRRYHHQKWNERISRLMNDLQEK